MKMPQESLRLYIYYSCINSSDGPTDGLWSDLITSAFYLALETLLDFNQHVVKKKNPQLACSLGY